MSLKGKIISIILFTCLTMVLITIGVWAVPNIDFTISGDLEYVAPEIEYPTPEDTADYPYLTFSVIDATNKYASVQINRGVEYPTEIILPSYVELDGETYSVTNIPGGYDTGKGFAYTNITSITLPTTLKTLDAYSFSMCQSLTTCIIYDGIERTNGAFNDCSKLNYNIYDNAKYIGNENNPYVVCMRYTEQSITSCIINDNCKIIDEDAFRNRTSLESVTIPDSVTTIERSAFKGCTGLTSIEIPNSVTSIANSVFEGCTGLTSVTIPASVTSLNGGAFYGCGNLTTVVIDSETVANGLTSMLSMDYVIYYAKTIYIKTEIVTAGKVGSYVTANYPNIETITSGDYAGYTKYSK